MIIDLILDRKDGNPYNPKKFYEDVGGYGETWPELANPICLAMDEGTEDDVKKELCWYVMKNDYSMLVCDYINSVNWL